MPKRAAIIIIEGYRRFIRWMFPCSCRFIPSCSEYAKQAIAKYGLIRGGARAMLRILRCHPFSGRSGFDPLL